MKFIFSLSCFLFLLISPVFTQTFSAEGDSIPDDGTPKYFKIKVSDISRNAIDTIYGLEKVCVNISHTYDSDLEIFLIAPDSTVIDLCSGNGGGDDNFYGTCFTDTASHMISAGGAPFTGYYMPEELLSTMNDGKNPNGEWTLYVRDTYSWADSGIVHDWSISFGSHPCKPIKLDSSELPIVVINTYGQIIPDDPKIFVKMGVINNGAGKINKPDDKFNDYDGYATIERRGYSSQSFPKKSYSLETSDYEGDAVDVPLLGMPKESDWCLIANFSDKTLMRNALTYLLFSFMGNCSVRVRFCELVLNGEYKGVYLLTEKIKRHDSRVNISKLFPSSISGDALTGGYIIKIDRANNLGDVSWQSRYSPPNGGPKPSFVYHYPKGYEIMPVQADYIKNYISGFEDALADNLPGDTISGYRKYIDVKSFIDFFLLNELSKNVDGYRLSTFFYKDRDSKDGKMKMGPVWDFDLAWGNADYYDASNINGWMYQFPSKDDGFQTPFWWDRLLTESFFTDSMKCRWYRLRSTVLSDYRINMLIDSMALLLDNAQKRNFRRWPIIGIYVWPNPQPLPQSYEEGISSLKSWIFRRIDWLYSALPGWCDPSGVEDDVLQPQTVDVSVYPNPFVDYIRIAFDNMPSSPVNVRISDILGNTVYSRAFNNDEAANILINLSDAGLTGNVYFSNISFGGNTFTKKIIKFNNK